MEMRMNKKYLLLFFPLCLMALHLLSCSQYKDESAEDSLSSLLSQLDEEIRWRDKYVQEKKERIRFIHTMDDGIPWSQEMKYKQNLRLYEAFFPFQFDSALFYINENIHMAVDKVRYSESSVELALLYTVAGMYLEAQEILANQIDTTVLDQNQMIRYYTVQHRFNRDFREYSKNPFLTIQAAGKLKWYRTRLNEVLPDDSDEKLELIVSKALDEKEFAVADSANTVLLGRYDDSSHKYAMYAYNQAIIDYQMERNTFRHWYVRSAIADLRSAVKDNASIASIARQLFDDEDVERAFRYITVSMDDAIYFNAKLRPWQIAQIMPVIEKAYNEKSDSVNRLRWLFTIAISIFALILFFFAVGIYKTYRKMLFKAEELRVVNERLSELNVAVSEANSVKEEYIALLLSMCSDYIDKMNDMEQDIKRKLTIGMSSQILKDISSSRLMKNELENFYNMFDTTFLKLYPDFVNEFNQLLREEERVVLPEGSLNTELRIFALIRLGITDSSRIAVLLRYSVQTIYNYRMRMKKRSIYDKDVFEMRLRTIGSFRH